MRIKLLHCSDLHLDAPFTSLSDMEGRPEQRRQELKALLERIVELARAEQVDLMLVCGDLYEHGYIRKSTIRFLCDQFEKIKEIPVIIIPGNHDPATVDSFYHHWEWPSNVHILKDDSKDNSKDNLKDNSKDNLKDDSAFYEDPVTGVRVYGDLISPEDIDNTHINILMFHGTLDMPFSTDAYQPVSSAEMEGCGFDYCAMGHFHTRRQGAGVTKRIYNPGSPEPLGFDEIGEHGVFITSIDKQEDKESNIQTMFKKMNLRSFIKLDVQAGGCLTDEQAALRIAAAMESEGSGDDLYRVLVHGFITPDLKIDTAYITELLKAKAFYLRITDQTTPDYDFDQIAAEPGLRGLFVKKMLDRAAKTMGAEEKQLVMQALYYGMQAIDEGAVCI